MPLISNKDPRQVREEEIERETALSQILRNREWEERHCHLRGLVNQSQGPNQIEENLIENTIKIANLEISEGRGRKEGWMDPETSAQREH